MIELRLTIRFDGNMKCDRDLCMGFEEMRMLVEVQVLKESIESVRIL